MSNNEVKLIAFYLPQFHAIPENDTWWGNGFTEWTNIKKAKPLFREHYQPRIPLDKNYYNLLDESVIKKQFLMAKEYGLYGFCFYHYWFNGTLLLERPIERVINSDYKIPYCLCWANEPWTRSWDGNSNEILISQCYGGEKEWEKHFNYLKNFFCDKYYIKKENKPVLILYRTNNIQNCDEMILYWDKKCKRSGFSGIYIIEEKNTFQNKTVCKGSNAVLEFEPMYTLKFGRTCRQRVSDKIRKHVMNKKNTNQLLVYKYDEIWKNIIRRKHEKSIKKQYYGAFVDWDNTPRKGKNGLVMLGGTPQKFSKYMSRLIKKAKHNKSEMIFINAWNEWAEGTYLEPDEKNKYAYLKAIKAAIKDNLH
jgi:hypothetical protein